jgi:hypothetical protein
MFEAGSEEEAENRMTFEGSPPPKKSDAPAASLPEVAGPTALWPQGRKPWAR